MSMDKSAIEQIQQSQTAQVLNEEVSKLNLDYALLVPDNFAIKSLESYFPQRLRFRGEFKTQSLNAFTAYVEQHKDADENTTVFINDENMSAKCIFDLGEAEKALHCDHKAILNLPKTAPYNALLDFNGRTLDQAEFAEFLEDWRHNILCFDSAENEINLVAAIARIRKITVENARTVESEVQSFSNTASIMDKVEARNSETLPAMIRFACAPYAELCERTFELRVSLKTGSTKPMLVARIIGFEAIKEEIADEFKEILDGELSSSNVETFVGTFSS